MCAAFVTVVVNQNTSKLFLPSVTPTNKISLLLFSQLLHSSSPFVLHVTLAIYDGVKWICLPAVIFFSFDLGFKCSEHENF